MHTLLDDPAAILNEKTELRQRFFSEWRKHHPDALSDDDWAYVNIYYDITNTETKWMLLETQDKGLMTALSRFSRYKFYQLLQYVYATKPSDMNIEFIAEFDLHPGEGESFKLRKGSEFVYFWRGEEHSEQEFLAEINELFARARQLELIRHSCVFHQVSHRIY